MIKVFLLVIAIMVSNVSFSQTKKDTVQYSPALEMKINKEFFYKKIVPITTDTVLKVGNTITITDNGTIFYMPSYSSPMVKPQFRKWVSKNLPPIIIKDTSFKNDTFHLNKK